MRARAREQKRARGCFCLALARAREPLPAGDASHPFFFVTVKGAGHMVPQYEPVFALTLLENFLAFDF